MQLQDDFPCLGHLVRICRPDHNKSGHCAHVGKVLDWLMSRTVLANSDGVVRKYVYNRQLHQGTQTKRAAHVIHEDEKTGAEGPNFHQTHSVEYRAHGVLADSKMKIASGIILSREITGAFLREAGLGGGREICRSPDQPGNVLGGCIQDLCRRFTRSKAFWIDWECWQVSVPSFWQLAVLHAE